MQIIYRSLFYKKIVFYFSFNVYYFIYIIKFFYKMVRIILNEHQIFSLICEALSLDDIYAKYYSNIDSDIFRKIVESDPTWRDENPDKMGKYGKWLLKLYISKRLKLEDLYKANEYLSYFIKYINMIDERDINKYSSLQDLYNVIRVYIDNSELSTSKSDEVRKIKEGAEKVYEDNDWLIIVPHTKEASCYYGKGTQWCTAASSSHNMFDDYNSQGTLYININKNNGEKYQFHFETDEFMDPTNTPIESPINETIGLSDGCLDYYKSNLLKEHFNLLLEERNKIYSNNDGVCHSYFCKSPLFNYYSYYIKNCYGDYSNIIAKDLKSSDYNHISYNLYDNGFALIDNVYGYYTFIIINNEDCPEYIGCDYISVDKIDDIFDTFVDDRIIFCLVNKEGIMEIYDVESGIVHYSINMKLLDSRGSLDNSGIIWIKKRDGSYDLIDIYYEFCLYNLSPIDKSDPFKFDDSGEKLYMVSYDEVIEIDLYDGLSYKTIDNINNI